MLFPFSFMQTTLVSTPVATAATGVGQTSFTANWNAFAGASYYLLDVSTSSSFSSFVGSYQNFVVISNSQVVSGLTANTTYYYRLRAATGVDADAAAFFGRVYTAGGALSYTEVSATETLVADLKSAGIWTPMKAIYPMVGASAAACAQNLKSSSFTGTFTSGWTFASTGVTPNGTSAYMSSGLVPSSVLSSQDSQHYSMYSRTNIAESRYGFGSNDVRFALKWGDSILYAKLGSLELAYGTNSTTLGLHLMSRTNSTNLPVFVRNTKINLASVSSSLSGLDILLGARQLGASVDSYGTRQFAFASIGDGLDDTQASNFYTAVQAFQTTLARQVV